MTSGGRATVNKRTDMEIEVLSQPSVWSECLASLAGDPSIGRLRASVSPDAEWLFVGCGSSYYIAQAAAATFVGLGLPARAVPASELLLFPDLVMDDARRPRVPVLISRSGRTSEILRAAEYLTNKRAIPSYAITCSKGEPLEKLASLTLHTLAADERSTVMTRSFTSMLLGLQYAGATIAANVGFQNELRSLPAAVTPLLDDFAPAVRDFVRAHEFADYVFLAQGPLLGIANESALKVTESSVSYAQSFHTMEFRHGPKSIVSPETLVCFLLSESGYEAEVEVLDEIKELGGTTLVVANSADARARKAADLLIELKLPVAEPARPAAYVIWAQLLGLYTGLNKGLDPDQPRHLSRVVELKAGR